MPKDNTWEITLNLQEGLAPLYFKNTYPFYGNKDHWQSMKDIDLTDPNLICQGPRLTGLTNGAAGESVTTLIKGLMRVPLSDGSCFAIGGDQFYNLTSTAIGTQDPYPYTISNGGSELGEDVVRWKKKIYGFYNNASGGDIMEFDLDPDSGLFYNIKVDWGSDYPVGAAALEDAPHQAINGGDDDLYFTNGPYVGRIYMSSSSPYIETEALDFWTGGQTASLSWNFNRVIIAFNNPNASGAKSNNSGIYFWNGVSSSWEGDPIEVNGRIGALYTKNGTTFVWWQESGKSNRYNLGFINGSQLKKIKQYSGTLPLYYQVGEAEGFITWISDGEIYYYGPLDDEMNVRSSKHCSGTYSTESGGIATPFGDLLVATGDGSTNYVLETTTGRSNSATGKTIAYKVSGPGIKSQIDLIQIDVDPIPEGGSCDITLYYDKAKSSKSLVQMNALTSSPTIYKLDDQLPQVEDFQIQIDYSNSSPDIKMSIRGIFVQGHYILNK